MLLLVLSACGGGTDDASGDSATDGAATAGDAEAGASAKYSRTTHDYTVAMTVVSIRFSDEPLHQKLKASARRRHVAVSTLAERLIDEGLRMEAHPSVVYRDGPSGRRPALVAGPEVADVIGAMIDVDERRSRAAQLLNITEASVDAALAYYADYTTEIDAELSGRAQAAEAAEASWHRQRALLGR